MKRKSINSLLMLLAGALIVIAAPVRSQAQYFRLNVDEISTSKTTDETECVFGFCSNDRDEVYFTISGASDDSGPVELPRISPPAPEDYFGLFAPQNGSPAKMKNIALWNGHWFYLAEGQSAFFAVAVREQDNAQLSAIESAVKFTALGLGAIFIDPTLGAGALSELKNTAVSFVNSLSTDGDDTIGAFTVRVTNQNGNLTASWEAIRDATVISQSSTAASFRATGGAAMTGGEASNYFLRVNVQRSVRIVNKYSGKCVDVAGASLSDGANIQQYTCHGGANQQWVLSPVGVSSTPTYAMLPATQTGKCMDVAGASTLDQANVQQYTCHFGFNQRWTLIPVGGGDYEIRNVNSNKCLDVAGAVTYDGGNVQQFSCHGGPIQKWRLN